MTVSIIIPCFNQSAYLGRALQSVQQQTLQDWEAIVVDDGSTDESPAIAKTFAASDTRIRLLTKENGGSGSARNMGLDNARGEYIQFLDADDTIAPDKLERQTQAMRQQNVEISYTDFSVFDDKQSYPVCHRTINYRKALTRWGIGASIPIHAFLYKRSLVESIRFDHTIRQREDWYWALQVLRQADRCIHVPVCGAFYYQNEKGKTGSVIKMQRGNFIFIEQMFAHMHGWARVGWLYRLAEEYWMYILRRIKTHDAALRSTLPAFTLHTCPAILLMPVALLSVFHYTYQTYIRQPQ